MLCDTADAALSSSWPDPRLTNLVLARDFGYRANLDALTAVLTLAVPGLVCTYVWCGLSCQDSTYRVAVKIRTLGQRPVYPSCPVGTFMPRVEVFQGLGLCTLRGLGLHVPCFTTYSGQQLGFFL